MSEGIHKLNFGAQKMFPQRGRTPQKKSTVGTRLQSRANIACKGHSVMESEDISAGKDLGNCLA